MVYGGVIWTASAYESKQKSRREAPKVNPTSRNKFKF